LVVTLHGYDVTRFDALAQNTLGDKLYVKRRQQLWAGASLFICVSKFIEQRALEAGFPGDKLLVHYIGVDTDYFAAPLGGSREPVVLFVGRLVEKKGCSHLIQAMAEVQKHLPAAKLVVIGDGPDRADLERGVSRLNINCTFWGSQPLAVIRSWLWKAQLFCVPSLTARNGDSEGLGMVFAEAQAAGVPVVSFEHGGIPEVVRNGETGFLVKEGDSRALAFQIQELLEDRQKCQEASAKGIEWVRTRFDLRSQTKQLEDIYQDVLRRGT
jgi:glycosyltransferase involved in cell wall biosynthesis